MNYMSILPEKDLQNDDFKFLKSCTEQFNHRFSTRSLFRSEYEIRYGVLDDAVHPTPDSKYWQAIGEQNVQLTEFVNTVYEHEKLTVNAEMLEADIEELQEGLKSDKSYYLKRLKAQIREKQIQLKQNKNSQVQIQKTLQERMREIKIWETVISELETQLEFGMDNFELHHPKRYLLRYNNKMKMLDQLTGDAKESAITHFQSAMKHPDNIELIKVVTGLPTSENPQYRSITEAEEKDSIVADYQSRKVRKILVATPHRKQDDKNVTNFSKMQPPHTIACDLEQPFGLTVADARNFIAKKAIDDGYEYVFFVGDDNIIPRNALIQLLHHNTDIVGGVYYKKYLPLESVGIYEGKDGRPVPLNGYKIGDIIHNTIALPMDCTLIKTDVFKALEYPWYRTVKVQDKIVLTEDTYFSGKARQAGYDIITDTGVQSLHVDKEKGILYGHPEIVKNNQITPEWREYFAIGG